MRRALVIFITFSAVSVCPGTVITVDDDGPADFNNIQAAIDFASYGDTIYVAEGTYVADITLKNGVALIGQDPNNTIINGNDKEIGITSENCDSNTVLEGFKITNSFGMRNRYSSPRVNNCTFRNNHGMRYGGGMYNYESSLIVTDCNFIDNYAYNFGGGICSERSGSLIITNCTFSGNHAGEAGGGILNANINSTITDCNFINNSANEGAGVSNNYSGSELNVINCIFSGNAADYRGGGMCNEHSETNVINCIFSSNITYDDGGGMYNYYESKPNVINCIFSGNSADHDGGGMYNSDDSEPNVIDCTFSGNSAFVGGGMYNSDSKSIVNNCTFSDNSSERFGGGMYNTESNLTVTDCAFISNSTIRDSSSGGGMYNRESILKVVNCVFNYNESIREGGGMYSHSNSNLTVTNCEFIGNSATGLNFGSGGGMYNSSSSLVVTNCALIGNSAIGKNGCGGGMNNASSNLTLTNCALIGNSAIGENGCGGGMNNYISNLAVTNCTFSDNSAYEFGGGMANISGDYPTVTNSIFRANTATLYPQIYDYLDSLIITYSDIEGVWEGEGNIDTDPCFAEQGYWADVNDPNIAVEPNDPNAIWIDGDYHLQSEAGRWDANSQSWVIDANTSPCIDAGDWMSPIGFEPFPNGGRVNMGAYGGTAEASKSYFGVQPCETIIAGDINGDCLVNFADFAIMALHWLEDARP